MSERLPEQSEIIELTTPADPVRVIAYSHYVNPQALQSTPFPLGHFAQQFPNNKSLEATILYTPDRGSKYTVQSLIELPGNLSDPDLLDRITERLQDGGDEVKRSDNEVSVFPQDSKIGTRVRLQSMRHHTDIQSLIVEPWCKSKVRVDEVLFEYDDKDVSVDSIVTLVAATTTKIFSLLYQQPENSDQLKPQFEISLPGSVLQESFSQGSAISRLLKEAGVKRLSHLEYPSFDDLGGIDQHIERLKLFAEQFAIPPEAWKAYGLEPTRGILLQGPAGVGKTDLVKALARETGFELRIFNSSDIMSMWVGQSGKELQSVFEKAVKRTGRQILFFDECDGLFSDNAGGNAGAAKSLISTFKSLMTDKRYSGVIVAMAANSFDNFDPALLRSGRFDTVLKIQKPDEAGRCSIIMKQIDRFSEHFHGLNFPDVGDDYAHDPDAIDVLKLAHLTNDLTGADIKAIMQGLRFQKLLANHRTQTNTLIGQSQLERAIREYRQNRPNDI